MLFDWRLFALIALLICSPAALAQEDEEEEDASAAAATADDQDEAGDEADDGEDEESDEDKPRLPGALRVFKWRSLGPGLMSGRIGDIALDPTDPHTWYVAVSSGGVWKTTNHGVTFKPIFDSQGSYSIGCVTVDPSNPNTVWVGSGENNSQRSVSWGDGVYVSHDGGRSWKNTGLKESEHIGMIVVHPEDSNTVYVAAQGPLWRSGGDRGLYKTTDGGETWERILHISDDTGVNEVHMDPRDPDVLYASSYQRRRRVWTLINGGPESAIYKSVDGGANWDKLTRGIPGGDKGRIGMDISPVNPDVVYAIIEAQDGGGGVFRTTDRGARWSKMGSYMTSSPQYYNELVASPHDVDTVYALDTFLQVSTDGGRSFSRVARDRRHVDDHALWINPENADHMIVGSDGGLYETWDHGTTWRYAPNLPVMQFYRVAVDNSEPFYYIYGGTQDNNTIGGPSRSTDRDGVTNEDWFVTVGGDGFEPAIDPEDPNIVYSQWQYGGLVRYDRRSGQQVDIKPVLPPGEGALKWNWDSPLLISPHDHETIFFGANRMFRSPDRGDSWEVISPDLTKQINRDELEVMGRIQPENAVSKHRSTSMYGNLVAFDESPLVEGLYYAGADDGRVTVSEDGGQNWRDAAVPDDVPELPYTADLCASLHNPDRVFVAFDLHKEGDFKPYLYRSDDRGRTWTSISSDLPEHDVVYSIVEDHEREDLLFAGTEFGCYVSFNAGEAWHKLKSGLPTISVRDIDVQRRENDLVLATFGRGFYVLDDYAPLRAITEASLREPAAIYPIRDALRYIPTSKGRGSQGSTFYTTENPDYGAVITWSLGESLKTRKAQRKAEAKELGDEAPYPTLDQLREEDEELPPAVWLTIRDADNEVVRRLKGSTSRGLHRTAWDLRRAGASPITGGGRGGRGGPLVAPGTYTVSIDQEIDGAITNLAGPQSFVVKDLGGGTFDAEDPDGAYDFDEDVLAFARVVQAATTVMNDADEKIDALHAAILATPDAPLAWRQDSFRLRARMLEIKRAMNGDRSASRREFPTEPSITRRLFTVSGGRNGVTSPPTQTQIDGLAWAKEAFGPVYADLKKLVEQDIPELERRLESVNAPYTPGRALPEWRP